MIVLSKLRWGNLFSYGDNNELDFIKNPLTQIIGANGFGKSSIALILEEVLYNKNSKNIKKADILNRNVKAKSWWIELEFFKDNTHYLIKTNRSTTQTVKLFENGVDISSHTATATYNTIQNIIVYDHKTFSQLVYQSGANSLEFLTATDGNRKKFLIDLLNLSLYVSLGEVYKTIGRSCAEQINIVISKISTIESWIDKYKDTSLEEKPIQEIPDPPRDLMEKVTLLKDTIANIESTNKKIAQNNKYKELRDAIVLDNEVKKPEELDYSSKMSICNKIIKDESIILSRIKALENRCPTCLQDINLSFVNELLTNHSASLEKANTELKELTNKHNVWTINNNAWKKELNKREEYEKYHNLYDPKLNTSLLSKEDLELEIIELEKDIKIKSNEIKSITESNNAALAHNARVELIKSQIVENQTALSKLQKELEELSDRNNIIQILIKTFSPTGLIAYKIECLIKDLEVLTNEYLTELSDGRFQLTFKISSDKLNVIITDNSKDIEITALSSGEKARVNAAALLGIRKLMQSLSNSRINLLILDETIENLDFEGKEKLVEVLRNEESLNTFIISHSFQHPLLERIYVTKTNNISRIE